MVRVLGTLLVAVMLTGCAADIEVPYPYPQPTATGSVLIKFTEPMRQVHVEVDGALVVEDEFTDRVLVGGVPVGTHRVGIAASDGHRSEAVQIQRAVDVQADRTTTILVGAPPASTGFWVYMAALVSAYWVAVYR